MALEKSLGSGQVRILMIEPRGRLRSAPAPLATGCAASWVCAVWAVAWVSMEISDSARTLNMGPGAGSLRSSAYQDVLAEGDDVGSLQSCHG